MQTTKGLPELKRLEIMSPQFFLFREKNFLGLPKLETVILHCPYAYPIDDSCFDKTDFQNCTLIVPYGSSEDYKKANGWKRFCKIIEDPASVASPSQEISIEMLPDQTIRLNSYGEVSIYSLDGRKVATLTDNQPTVQLSPGIYVYTDFVNQGKLVIK